MNNRDKPARPMSVAAANGSAFTSNDFEGGEGLTKLEDLAMRLYERHVTSSDCAAIESDELARESIKLANIFFDQLDESEKPTTLK